MKKNAKATERSEGSGGRRMTRVSRNLSFPTDGSIQKPPSVEREMKWKPESPEEECVYYCCCRCCSRSRGSTSIDFRYRHLHRVFFFLCSSSSPSHDGPFHFAAPSNGTTKQKREKKIPAARVEERERGQVKEREPTVEIFQTTHREKTDKK